MEGATTAAPPSAATTVYVVDDDPAMRASLRWLIESVGLTVRTAGSAQEFLETYERGDTGCVVLDMRMPGMSGLDLQAELQRQGVDIPVLIITGYAEVPLAVRAMKAGAFDFIEKPFSDQTLLDRIRAAVALNAVRRNERAVRELVRARYRLLTPRERAVMDRVVAGMSNKMIAADLQIHTKTVEVHRAHVMEKMQAGTLAELIRLALLARDPEPSDPASL